MSFDLGGDGSEHVDGSEELSFLTDGFRDVAVEDDAFEPGDGSSGDGFVDGDDGRSTSFGFGVTSVDGVGVGRVELEGGEVSCWEFWIDGQSMRVGEVEEIVG